MISFLENLRKTSGLFKEGKEVTQETSADVSKINAEVKASTSMINRIQQGHNFGIVIGLDIETALYRTPPELKINNLIQPLRETFIFEGTGINVINGVALLQHMQDTGETEYPFAIGSLPAVSDIQQAEIKKQLSRIFNRISTVYDLISDESAHSNDNPGAFIKFIDKITLIKQPES
ncbi:MAG: hypothetical protein DIZ80_00210 [endosymbiont of Galathealinum brachiosum]|uniref:Uncharacterized protein n=1 Tax=endosymbiont of Galathealinum brachiosum TaxID=2200906 RepID=A0A370DNI3_9GAMM|nr:MAG: hypothetical protein DIZ80_00210 [endosymbiont of Galathealinum brachiosum]